MGGGGSLTHSGNQGVSLEEVIFELNLEERDSGDGGLGKNIISLKKKKRGK